MSLKTIDLTKSLESKTNRDEWVKWKFSDLVENIVEKIVPKKCGLEHYIGLKHLDSGSLKIRRYGKSSEIDGDKLKIYKGDLIFAKRNSYLKRVAIADFDAVASAHSLVLRPKPENVLPEFMSFLMMSEMFWQRAIEISVGSLSPTINWKVLAKQEFLLPAKDQQRKIVQLLNSIVDVVENSLSLFDAAKTQYEVNKNNFVLKGIDKDLIFSEKLKVERASTWKVVTVNDLIKDIAILDVQDGNHGDIHPKAADYVEDGIPFIMANTFVDGRIDFGNTKKLPLELTDKLRIGFSMPGDVLLTHKGTVGEVAIVPKDIQWPYLMLTPQVTYYRLDNSKLSNKFLYFVFTSNYFQNQLARLSSQSTRAYVGITAQKTLKVVVPDNIQEQLEIVEMLSTIESNLHLIEQKVNDSKALQKSLINQVF